MSHKCILDSGGSNICGGRFMIASRNRIEVGYFHSRFSWPGWVSRCSIARAGCLSLSLWLRARGRRAWICSAVTLDVQWDLHLNGIMS